MDSYVAENSSESFEFKFKLIKLGCFVQIALSVVTLMLFL